MENIFGNFWPLNTCLLHTKAYDWIQTYKLFYSIWTSKYQAHRMTKTHTHTHSGNKKWAREFIEKLATFYFYTFDIRNSGSAGDSNHTQAHTLTHAHTNKHAQHDGDRHIIVSITLCIRLWQRQYSMIRAFENTHRFTFPFHIGMVFARVRVCVSGDYHVIWMVLLYTFE